MSALAKTLVALIMFAALIAANIIAALAPVAPDVDTSSPSVVKPARQAEKNTSGQRDNDSHNATVASEPTEQSRHLILTNVAERPLFNPARKPAEPLPVVEEAVAEAVEHDPEPDPEPTPAPPPAAVPQGLALVAIVSDGGMHAALIRVGGAPYARKVVRGDDVDDWTVGAIDPQSMVLEHGGTRCAFVLGKATPESGPCAARRTSEPQAP